MKAAVITFPGSNCDDDNVHALARTGFEVDRLWHRDTPGLGSYALIVLPGGFSFGDTLRCGAIAALSPIVGAVKEYAAAGGLVAGICNGFQILCETGLLPGALARNESLNFVCQDVHLKVESAGSPWTRGIASGTVLTIPIAHGEGRYVVDEATHEKMARGGQILFTYCDARGAASPGSNPNGSMWNVAGVCNETGNVFGMMPHPERATDLRSRDGAKLWRAALEAARAHKGPLTGPEKDGIR